MVPSLMAALLRSFGTRKVIVKRIRSLPRLLRCCREERAGTRAARATEATRTADREREVDSGGTPISLQLGHGQQTGASASASRLVRALAHDSSAIELRTSSAVRAGTYPVRDAADCPFPGADRHPGARPRHGQRPPPDGSRPREPRGGTPGDRGRADRPRTRHQRTRGCRPSRELLDARSPTRCPRSSPDSAADRAGRASAGGVTRPQRCPPSVRMRWLGRQGEARTRTRPRMAQPDDPRCALTVAETVPILPASSRGGQS
jgi:hypothetical protein